MDYKNYIFDLYGTLIDVWTDERSRATWERFNTLLDGYGLRHGSPGRMCNMYFTKDAAARRQPTEFTVPEIDIVPVFADILAHYGNRPEDIRVSLEEICYDFRVSSRLRFRLFPNTLDLLEGLHAAGKKVYLLSNAQAAFTVPEIEALGLDKLLNDILISSDRKCMKPDPAFYQMLIDKHGLRPQECLMIGDSVDSDIKGALLSGIDSVLLTNERYSRDQAKATLKDLYSHTEAPAGSCPRVFIYESRDRYGLLNLQPDQCD